MGRYPWLYRGREFLGWLVDCGFWDQRPEDLPSPADTRLANPLVGSGGRSLDLRILAGLGVTLLGRFEAADGERVTFGGSLVDHVAYADAVATRLKALADDYIARQGIDAPEAEPDPTRPVEPVDTTELDLAAADVTSIIWCTGFTGDLPGCGCRSWMARAGPATTAAPRRCLASGTRASPGLPAGGRASCTASRSTRPT